MEHSNAVVLTLALLLLMALNQHHRDNLGACAAVQLDSVCTAIHRPGHAVSRLLLAHTLCCCCSSTHTALP